MIYPIPSRSVPGKDHMAFWEGFLSNEDINLLLAQPEWLNLQNGCIGGAGGANDINLKIRSSQVAWVGAKAELQPIWEKLATAVAEVRLQTTITSRVNCRFYAFVDPS
jgi:hypothetical protein